MENSTIKSLRGKELSTMDSIPTQGAGQHEPSVDEILNDVKGILAEDSGAEAAPLSAEDIRIDYEGFYGEAPEEETSQPPGAQPAGRKLTFYEQSKPDYQRARREEAQRRRAQERLEREQKLHQREQEELSRLQGTRHGHGKKKARKTAAEYAQWLYEQGLGDNEQTVLLEKQSEQAARRTKKTRSRARRSLRAVFTLVLLLALLTGVFHFVLAKQPLPVEPSAEARKSGCSTVLLAGTDEDGYRTDSMMLLSVNRKEKRISLTSIPRDTLIFCEYAVPKLNSAYGWASGGTAGAQQLMMRVAEIIGFEPDGYAIVNLSVFQQFVDLMGGIEFDVPMDMRYTDAAQGLYIDLKAGLQKLDGEKAMQVARFRYGYAMQDLDRTTVQRELLSAAAKQWLRPGSLLKLPQALELLQSGTNTSLTRANFLWLAESLLLCGTGQIESCMLPGSAQNISGGSYYVLDPIGVADTVNAYCNPYEKGVAAEGLSIRAG